MRSFLLAALLSLPLPVLIGACKSDDAPPGDPPCTPAPHTATDPFAVEHDPSSAEVALARAIADRWIDVHPAESMQWNWVEGVLGTALVDLTRVTADTKYSDYYRAWIDHHIAQGYEVMTSDKCLPAATSSDLYATTCKAEYKKPVDTVLNYLDHEAIRTDEGGINHLGTSTVFPPSIWIDSLYMFGEVLIRWGATQNDAAALDLYRDQFVLFSKRMQDPNAGFYVHAYGWVTPLDPNVFWARGNGWVITSGYDYVRTRKDDESVKAPLAKLAAAIVASQDSSGLWWTVVNRPGDTYLETSGSALFAAGLARGHRVGALGPEVIPVVTKAVDAIKTRIKNDDQGRPVVTGIAGPTDPGGFANYANVKVEDDLAMGVGAVIFALIESSGLR